MKLRMIPTFLRACWYFIFIRRGETLSNKDRNARIRICKACPELCDSRCKVCGCWVHLKTWCIDEHCPLELW
jgi:hypothetical protein